MSSNDPTDSPLDRALQLALAGDEEASLRLGASEVKSDLENAGALYAIGRALVAMDKTALARRAFECAAGVANNAGNLPLAIAAGAELRVLGKNPTALWDNLAAGYCDGSSRLLEGVAKPPAIQHRAPKSGAIGDGVRGNALIAEVDQVLEYAQASLDSAEQSTRIPPQILFSSLSRVALRSLLDIFEARVVKGSEVLIRQGESGDEAFVLARGELEVRRDMTDTKQVQLARLGAGALFGEMALLARAPRAATVEAIRVSVVLRACKKDLDSIAAENNDLATEFAAHCRRRMVANVLNTSGGLQAVKASLRPALIERFVTRVFEKGQKLVTAGQRADGLHLIASGSVIVSHDGETLATLGMGDAAGEISLILRRNSNADVIAVKPTISLCLPEKSFLGLVEDHPSLLAELYLLAVRRDDATTAQIGEDASNYVMV